MHLWGGLIVGIVAGLVMWGVTEEVYWLPIGLALGVIVGTFQTKRRRREP